MEDKVFHPFSELMREFLVAQYEQDLDGRGGKKDFNRASAIGRDFYTNYHYRIGTEPTNHPTAEGLGKMKSGDVFHEYIQDLFEDMGILNRKEFDIEIPELKVKGHPDADVGRKIDYDKEIAEAQAKIDEGVGNGMPLWKLKVKVKWLTKMREIYPDGLDETIVDIKSLGAFRFDKKDKFGWEVDDHHALQVCEYALALGYKKALILYVCREDFRLAVCEVNPEDYRDRIWAYWNELNGYVERGEEPPIEEKIIYEEDGRPELNWHILYSPYLTKMYPQYNTKEELREHIDPIVREQQKSWERNKLIGELREKYPDADKQTGRLLELYNLKQWSSTEYSCLCEITGKKVAKGVLVEYIEE